MDSLLPTPPTRRPSSPPANTHAENLRKARAATDRPRSGASGRARDGVGDGSGT
jgi:hypothetical protein